MATVQATKKFGVLNLQQCSVVRETGVVHVGAGRRVQLADLERCAAGRYEVILDAATLEKFEQEECKGKGKGKEVEMFSLNSLSISDDHVSALPFYFCRASILACIVALMHDKAVVKTEVLVYLKNMLNLDIVPAFTSESCAGDELVSFVCGIDSSKCHTASGVLNLASAAGVKGVQLSNADATTLRQCAGHYLMSGIASLVAAKAVSLSVGTADCIAALSCEAVSADTAPFDSSMFDVGRQQRGQMFSATNIRSMVEASKRSKVQSTTQTASTEGARAYACIPQVHGPAIDAITQAAKVLETELNSYETNNSQAPHAIGFDPSQSKIALFNITTAMQLLVQGSCARYTAVQSTAELAAPRCGNACSRSLLMQAAAVWTELSEVLCRELYWSMGMLKTVSATSNTAPATKGPEGGASGSGDSNAREQKDNKKKNDLYKDEVKSDALLAKIERLRQEKAEKAAKKAQAKAAKKGGDAGGGPVLAIGVGSLKLREKMAVLLGNQTVDSLVHQAVDGNFINVLHNFCQDLLAELGSGGTKKPRICRGARDFGPEQMRIREQAFTAIRRVFKRHGAVEIDTPVFELKEILTGKYGEDSKLIYDLADQGGELLCLRYDLTVPFARYLAMNTVGNIKRYHIAKVYRRDNPQPTRGRFREFYQCDFDVAGNYTSMVPDAEVLTVVSEILSSLPIGKFVVKLNHRCILDAVFELSGVPAEKFRTICSAVDKLDKATWEEVKEEMVVEKGLDEKVADRIGTFVCLSGSPKELWQKMTDENTFEGHAKAGVAMSEMKLLFEYMEAMDSLQYISFDMSLARGLDYYTGVIYEAVLVDGTSQIGSIAAGGRYDNLVGMFSTSAAQTPCVGVSIGVERVFAIMEKNAEKAATATRPTIEVFVASIGPNLLAERMRLSKALWNANISAEFSHQDNPKFKKQLDEVLERAIPYMIVFGQEEKDKGMVKLKNMAEHTEVEIPLTEMVAQLVAQGCQNVSQRENVSF